MKLKAFTEEAILLHKSCALDGPCGEIKEQPSCNKGGKSPAARPGSPLSGESVQGLAKSVKQLQSEVDKLKYAEHKRRELARAVKERQKAEEELKEWLSHGGRGTSRGHPSPIRE